MNFSKTSVLKINQASQNESDIKDKKILIKIEIATKASREKSIQFRMKREHFKSSADVH